MGSDYSYDENNRIQTSLGRGYTFDRDGNLVEIDDGATTPTTIATLGFDKVNRLRTYTEGSVSASYVYDPFGRRIRKAVTGGPSAGTTVYLWDGDQLLAEYDEASPSSATRSVRYVYGGGWAPLQMVEEGTTPATYEVHSDHLATPQMLTDGSDVPVWRADYAAFGSAAVSGDPDGDPMTADPGVEFNIRFPGQYFDGETGLHYNRFRYYGPSIGRYINADPIGQAGGINLYTYALSNPVSYIDPEGLASSGKTVDLGGGTTVRIDKPHVSGQQTHAHVTTPKGEAVVNQDGTPSHTGRGKPGNITGKAKKFGASGFRVG